MSKILASASLALLVATLSACPLATTIATQSAGITTCVVTTEQSTTPPPPITTVLNDCGALFIDDVISDLTQAFNTQTKAGNTAAAAYTKSLIDKYTAAKRSGITGATRR
jgi:hypothetical protein